jgi:MOSC domain-containing protein YiiM
MQGSVLQINVSKGGVLKLPIAEAQVTPLGIEGDLHEHPEIHGGPRQALLLITAEGIEELTRAGFAVYPGALGENITTQGLDRRAWRVGQRWGIGPDVIVEFTKIRGPCKTILVYGPGIQTAIYDAAVRDGDPSSPRWGLSGFYARVIRPGAIRRGDGIAFLNQFTNPAV